MAYIGICKKYKGKKPFRQSHYEIGHKRCSTCDLFVKWNGNNCPCCGMQLRHKPRGTIGRQRMVAILQNKKV
jgi:predicted amidophosphoribosyltransferase